MTDLRETWLAGSKLSPEEVKQLEAGVTANPDDLDSRVKLIGYHFAGRGSRERRAEHCLWLIEHHPGSEVAVFISLDQRCDPEGYERAKVLWLRHVDEHPEDPHILRNAALFFMGSEDGWAEQLLERGRSLDPSDPSWELDLRKLKLMSVVRRAQRLNVESEAATVTNKESAREALEVLGPIDRWVDDLDESLWLEQTAKASLLVGDLEEAERLASDLLALAAGAKLQWNQGNAIHAAHLALGRVALRRGDIAGAKAHLLDSARTRGSPQLNTFGPNMRLAKELLDTGERDVVFEYFDLCESFWEFGHQRVARWRADLRAGATPYFGANLFY